MKTKLHFILLFIITGTTISIHAQNAPNAPKEEKTVEVLEPATLRVIYTFSQQAKKERETVVLTDTMALTIGKSYSVYYDWNKKRNDSILREKSDIPMEKLKSVNVFKDETLLQSQLERWQEPSWITDESKGESALLFKNRINNEITILDKGPSERASNPIKTYLKVVENIAPQNWEISTDTLTVLGYPCQKATTTFRGRTYSAWFTLDIPVDEGPWKLYGLPGIILKAVDADGLFNFQAIGISQLSNENVEMPTDRKINLTTLNQLNDYRKNRFKMLGYNFFDGSNLSIYSARNPLIFNELEIEK